MFSSPNKFVGILYQTWFNYIHNHSPIAVHPTPVDAPNWRYWGTPAAGTYKSDDRTIINQHADMLAAAGIDFILIDFTNNNLLNTDMVDPTRLLIQEYQHRVSEGRPTPRIAFYLATKKYDFPHTQTLLQCFYEKYPSAPYFYYASKPLLLTDSLDDPAVVNFSARVMFGLHGTGAEWSLIERTPQPAYFSAEWPEQMPVSAAQQESHMNGPNARGRLYDFAAGINSNEEGRNFIDQWHQAHDMNPTFVIIKGWNEWVSQRFTKAQDPQCHMESCYTDEFNQEFSNDIEPMVGGHSDRYLQLLTSEVKRFKRNRPILFLRERQTGLWHIKHGRGGKHLAETNFAYTFPWAAGQGYQPIAGDFNGDGLIDIGLRDVNTGWWHFAISDGNRAFGDTLQFQWKVGANYEPLVGDFDGDGRLDIALRDKNTGIWYFAISDGHGGFNEAWTFPWAASNRYQPVVGDWNNDGRTDIGLRDTLNGYWHFAVYNSGAYNDSVQFPWVAGAGYQAYAADFDGDGNMDILVRNSSSGLIHLANYVSPGVFQNECNYQFRPGDDIEVMAM